MYIVHLIGSDEENPFKIFTTEGDAAADAQANARGHVERVFVYEWTGDLHEGLVAATEGRLAAILHYPHRKAPPAPSPERAIHLTKQQEEFIGQLIKKMPKIARKF